MKEPLVSVLMPVYNAARFVEQAVESVLSQTFGDFELLLTDDGSSDGSLAILQRLAARDSRIKLHSRPNAGLVFTLNEMLASARGELLARMDADDICKPKRLALQVSYLGEHPECVAVGSRCLFIDPDGLPILEFIRRYSHEEIEASLFVPEIGILHPSVMMRREAVRRVGGYRSEYPHVEDLDLFLRLGELGRLANLPEVLLEYRNHPTSVSHQNTVEQSAAGRRAVQDACIRRGLPPRDWVRFDAVGQPESPWDLHKKWAWWALGAGNFSTARKHALWALRHRPTSLESWRLAACVLLR